MPLIPDTMQTVDRSCMHPMYDEFTRAARAMGNAVHLVGKKCVRYHEGGRERAVFFGSHRRAKRFVRHLLYCRRVGDGPVWGPPVDVRRDDVSSRDPQRWRAHR